VTHDQIEAMTLATRVAVMKDGIVQHLDDPQTVYDRPANVYVARFVGSPSMNIIPGRLADDGTTALMDQPGGGQSRVDQVPLSDTARQQYAGKPVLVGIRPEGFSVSVAETAGVRAMIEVIEPTGPDTLAMFTLGGVEVIARLPPKAVASGQTASLAVDTAKVVLFDAETEARID
jgi:multiple sugar transport system ATP-binding protein